MVKAYFLSDIHLGTDDSPEEHKRQKVFLDFLYNIKNEASHIYFVGDLFDFWFEYNYVVPKKYFEFLHCFRSLTEKGIKLYYLAGNHDFSLGTFFDNYVKIETYHDEYTFELADKKFYLWHGDGLGKKDGGYRFLKKVMRNRINQKLFRLLHPDFGIPFARFVSGSSRLYTNQLNHLRDESDYFEFAEKQFLNGFDYVMMGHRHNPLVHQVGEKKYINLGDWINHFSYAFFNGQTLELKKYGETK
ncbi:MAG: UDP-2,3-diacylglucosamine diphosphatase [Calditrichaeota bacterium]|nr:UDP-2,3-diacylglucosamine diphosphatase [Calditrichota bacterium]